MVDFNELRNKAQSLISEHSEQVKSGIDKVGEVVGGKVGHDRADPIERKLHGLVDRLKGDTDPAAEQTTGHDAPGTGREPGLSDTPVPAGTVPGGTVPGGTGPDRGVPDTDPAAPGTPQRAVPDEPIIPVEPTPPAEPTLPEQPGSPSPTGRY